MGHLSENGTERKQCGFEYLSVLLDINTELNWSDSPYKREFPSIGCGRVCEKGTVGEGQKKQFFPSALTK